jgi:hypothetical protein
VSDTTDPEPGYTPESGDSLGAKRRYRLRQRFRAALVRLLEVHCEMTVAGVKADSASLCVARCVADLLGDICEEGDLYELSDLEVSLVQIVAQRTTDHRRRETISRYLRARALHYRRHPALPVNDSTPPTAEEKRRMRQHMEKYRAAHPGEDFTEYAHQQAVQGKGARPWWMDLWDEIEAEEASARPKPRKPR